MKLAKRFSRENPCTKIDLHNCFFDGRGGYRARPVVEAKMEIGDNSVKYLVKKEYLEERLMAGVDYYVPTAEGSQWLREGLDRYLVLHPERAAEVRQAVGSPARIVRRTAPAKASVSLSKPGIVRRTARR